MTKWEHGGCISAPPAWRGDRYRFLPLRGRGRYPPSGPGGDIGRTFLRSPAGGGHPQSPNLENVGWELTYVHRSNQVDVLR